jgi:hypothetical protein
MSSVGGWNVDARDSSLSPAPCSNTVTGTPARAKCAAATRPTGPAPATRTRLSLKCYSILAMPALVMMS